MNEKVTITLALVEIPPREMSEPETGYRDIGPDECESCEEEFEDGEQGIWHERRPYHPACYVKLIESSSVRDAWLTIAADISRNPSKHGNATVRATLQNLARLAGETS